MNSSLPHALSNAGISEENAHALLAFFALENIQACDEWLKQKGVAHGVFELRNVFKKASKLASGAHDLAALIPYPIPYLSIPDVSTSGDFDLEKFLQEQGMKFVRVTPQDTQSAAPISCSFVSEVKLP